MQVAAGAANHGSDVVQNPVRLGLVDEQFHIGVEQVSLGDVDPFDEYCEKETTASNGERLLSSLEFVELHRRTCHCRRPPPYIPACSNCMTRMVMAVFRDSFTFKKLRVDFFPPKTIRSHSLT